MKNKHFTSVIVLVIISLSSGFFAGSYYKNSQTTTSTAQIGTTFSRGVPGSTSKSRAGGIGGGIFGDIISKDNQSITVKLQSGGSQIVFVDPSTIITKSVSGTLTDLNEGTTVTINGTTNSDGSSLTANSINIRPQTASSTNSQN